MKLTKSEVEVLKAYRDNGTHNRSIVVFRGLLRKGFLAGGIKDGKPATIISESGKRALDLHTEGLMRE